MEPKRLLLINFVGNRPTNNYDGVISPPTLRLFFFRDSDARVVVTNGQRLFKFENITVPDGNFSVEYIFPDDGTHQVLTRMDKESAIWVLASFNVFVPHQAPPSILNPFPIPPGSELGENPGILLSIILAIMLPAAGVLGLIVIFKMGKTKTKRT
ncbi:MAG: hypothetical protein WCD28_14010 [Nitrososphaeraceae archaeon]